MKQTLFFPRRLNPADAGFFFLGQRRDCNVAMVMVAVLEREIPFADVLREFTAASDEVPRFKDYLRRAPFDLAPPVWIPKEGFEMGSQIHQTRLANPTWDEAAKTVDAFQSAPLRGDLPPWEALLVDGSPGGRSLLAMKVHHALSDGMALSLLFGKAFGGKALAGSGVEVIASSEPPPSGSRLRVALGDRAAAAAGVLCQAVRRTPRLLRDTGARRLELEALRRHLAPRHRAHASGYSGERRFSGFRVEIAHWEQEARKRGGSPNDLYLALVARTMARHFTEWDVSSAPLQIVMPVDVRGGALQDGGNVTGVGVVELTGSPADLLDLSRVHRRSRAVQQSAGTAAASLADQLVQLLPGRARAALQFREFATRDLVATNVPVPIPGELCGVPFQMMFMVAPPIGAAVGFSLTSYGDHFYLAANVDAAIAGGDFEESVALSLEEVFEQAPQSLRTGTIDLQPTAAPT